MTRIEKIRSALESALHATRIEIEDESHLHAGHAGAQSGRGHYRVLIVSSAFENLGPAPRHRAVYAALGALMQSDIHAISIRALTPQEAG
jgi:BolA protein